MENNSQELDIKTSSNKDMWLFLIVLDVIFLCVFGFFLYKHFTAKLVNPVPAVEATQTQTVETLPEEITVVTQTETIEVPASEEVKPEPIKEVKEEVVAPVVEETPAQVQQPTPTKESVVVTSVPNSKYRRVTFKWFGDGKQVAIVSGFTMSKPQALKKVGNHWETTLSIAPGTYKFLYIIDGKNTRDPYAAEKDGRSFIVIK